MWLATSDQMWLKDPGGGGGLEMLVCAVLRKLCIRVRMHVRRKACVRMHACARKACVRKCVRRPTV